MRTNDNPKTSWIIQFHYKYSKCKQLAFTVSLEYFCYMKFHLNKIKEAGYKLTRQRKNVVEILAEKRKPLTLNEIFDECNQIDFASVYRIIQLLTELKIVEEVNLGERQKRYELILDKHHHHILCKTCGKIDRIDYCILDKIKDLTNYNILNHSIEFIGICPDCQKN